MPRLRTFLAVAVLGFTLPLVGCTPEQSQSVQDIGNAIRDDDDDGWFENATNQRVTLNLVRIDFPVTSKFLPPFELEIDDVRFPLTGAAMQAGAALNIE